ncbi:hypothetical protein J2Z79_002394 [Symbiobacterium terraclitae]|uniref:DUF4367 domain-containing protein n=1 Tax=Symbiobacterium terraclitae TaxID=557451 RepID=A0ABS4JTW5_9FIRM|nr:hypothetical protein [Symbiobacterium terraclitae]MBP2018978.1 hypothetical protein [Symbiobacterium terraclitae]
MADLDRLIQEGFARGVAGHAPSDRWNAIAAALDGAPTPARRSRSPWAIVAASVAVLALLSLLYPPVRAAAVEGFLGLYRTVFKVRWEGRVGDTHMALVTPSDEEAPSETPGAGMEQPAAVKGIPVKTLDEAIKVAGFTPPTIAHDGVSPAKYEVAIWTFQEWEMRTVRIGYWYEGQLYILEAMGYADAAGHVAPLPSDQLISYSPPDEALGDIRTVDVGETQALCLERDYGQGRLFGHCQWLMEGLRVNLTGAELERVVELARHVRID